MTDLQGTADTVPSSHSSSLELTWASGRQIRDWICEGQYSALEVTEHFLERAQALDTRLHAFRTLDADGARAQAQAVDNLRRNGSVLGPLAGVPISVKEHIAIAGQPYQPLFAEKPVAAADRDSIVVERLRETGGIIFGTTMMPGMGNFGMPEVQDLSWHPRNPWDLGRVPGASTAGGAASVAAAMTPITIGSDAAGSSRLPAAFSGIIGFNSSFGRVPQIDYHFPIRPEEVTLGPMARDVRDAAIVMSVIAGPDGRDLSAIDQDVPDYLSSLHDGVDGLKLAWTDDFGFGKLYAQTGADRVIAAVRTAAMRFSEIGALVDRIEEYWADYWPAFIATVPTYGHPTKAAAYGASLSPAAYSRGVAIQRENWDRFQRVFSEYDLLLSPTVSFVAPEVEEWDRHFREPQAARHGNYLPTYAASTHIFSILGWPALSIPCGMVDGLPVGLQIIGKPDREPLILQAADAFLRAFPWNHRPAAII